MPRKAKGVGLKEAAATRQKDAGLPDINRWELHKPRESPARQAQGQRWRGSHTCTTSGLRTFLRRAYTGQDSPVCVRSWRLTCDRKGVEYAKPGAGAGKRNSKGTGRSARGRCKSVSGCRTPPQSGGALRTARKRRSGRHTSQGQCKNRAQVRTTQFLTSLPRPCPVREEPRFQRSNRGSRGITSKVRTNKAERSL